MHPRNWLLALIVLLIAIAVPLMQTQQVPHAAPLITSTQEAIIRELTEEPTLTPSQHPSPTPMPPVNPIGRQGDWELIFADEFDGTHLDREWWTVCYWWDNNGCTNKGNNELEWYTPDNVLIKDGILRLRAQKQIAHASDGMIYDFTSGMITTGPVTSEDQPGFTFRTGYAEIRAQVPRGAGLWPAFWLLPASLDSTPEIDVLEIIGDEPDVLRMHFHYIDEMGHDPAPGNNWHGPDFSADWHVYAVDWRADQIIWFVDGVEQWRFTDQRYIPDIEMYLLLNLAVGGDWPGPPTPETVFPNYLDIDYVRVWQSID